MGTTGYSDTFNRTVASGLGVATSGQTYTLNGVASQFSVTPSTASIAITSTGEKHGTIDFQTQNVDITGQVALSGIPATNLATAGFLAKGSNSSNYFSGTMMVATGGAISLRFSKLVAGSLVTISTTSTGLTYVANTFYNLRYQIYWSRALQTNVMSLKLWAIGATEPGGWMATSTDASFTDYTAGTRVGIYGRDESTVSGTITTKYRAVQALSYGLPTPSTTDEMCATPGDPVAGFCSIAIADGSFESGDPAGDLWYAQGGTVVGDTAVVHSGAWSALVTAVGSPGQLILRNSGTVPAAPGDVVNAQMWVWTSVDSTVLAVIDYYNGPSTYISSDSVSYPVLADTWTLITSDGNGAPATTTRVEYGPTIFGPSNGTIMRVDDADILAPCTVTPTLYPPETIFQELADAVDAVVVGFDPLADLAALNPRVRVSNSNVTMNTASFPPITFNATEFNIDTPTNLGFDNSSLYLPSGIWLVTFEIKLVEAASNYILLVFGGGPTSSNIFVDMRSNASQSGDQGVGGTGHMSTLVYSTDPTTPIQFGVSFQPNNLSTTYVISYMALSAIKISDYFA